MGQDVEVRIMIEYAAAAVAEGGLANHGGQFLIQLSAMAVG
jgi:hypothetical protein